MNVSTKEELHLFSQVLQKYLSPTEVEQLARTTEFVRRRSKCRGQDLVTLCVWLSHNLASTSLTQLCSELEAATGISMSAEGLNQRLNEQAVSFLRRLFAQLLKAELSSSCVLPTKYQDVFTRIRILDSTSFQLPDSLADHYPGSGGSSHAAGAKIQLEYDLYSGQFLNVDMGAGKGNDRLFNPACFPTLQPRDLCIRDLGYFSLDNLKQIDQQRAFYLSRLPLKNRIYQKNPVPEFHGNGAIKKKTEYLLLDLEEKMNQMKPEETTEIRDAFIGYKKLPARVILYRLTDVQVKKRRKNQDFKEQKKGKELSDKRKRLTGINVYITNIAWDIVPKEHIHPLYSLRWQIEIVFKTWKSFFQIDRCKNVKRERLECHLYGQLIAILICSSTLFQMRVILLRKSRMEVSEYKAFYIIQTYLPLFHQAIQKNTQAYAKILLRLFHQLKKNGRKSHRYKKKTIFDILGVVYEYSLSTAKVA
ncbi:IS4 family transposase [Shimazuella kribbensis]|uniref:IS4 family transposase n=1 Tax=Shimazuella kribbensis TaxID=139808 RepID=UPI00040455F4|nr:IS4 family transposase [Shimazuella kribbensis]